jgi:hypothetical protein
MPAHSDGAAKGNHPPAPESVTICVITRIAIDEAQVRRPPGADHHRPDLERQRGVAAEARRPHHPGRHRGQEEGQHRRPDACDKFCYTARVTSRNASGVIVATWDSKVIVSGDNELVTTPVPGGGC